MIRYLLITAAAGRAIGLAGRRADQQHRPSSARNMQLNAMSEIPVCTKRLGTIAIVEPDNQWWREYNLGSPEAILKIFVQRSGCFGIVNRGRSMHSRAMERAMADNGELQQGSNLGKGQVKTADYFLEPDIVTANRNSGGGDVGAAAGAIGGLFGGWRWRGRRDRRRDQRQEGRGQRHAVGGQCPHHRRGSLGRRLCPQEGRQLGRGRRRRLVGRLRRRPARGYQNTEIGQVIVLAYLDAYIKLVTQLGGLPANAAAAAPRAR